LAGVEYEGRKGYGSGSLVYNCSLYGSFTACEDGWGLPKYSTFEEVEDRSVITESANRSNALSNARIERAVLSTPYISLSFNINGSSSFFSLFALPPFPFFSCLLFCFCCPLFCCRGRLFVVPFIPLVIIVKLIFYFFQSLQEEYLACLRPNEKSQ